MNKIFLIPLFLLAAACGPANPAIPEALAPAAPAGQSTQDGLAVPHQERWGIYRLDIDLQTVDLLYSVPTRIATLRLDSAGQRLVFSHKIGGESDSDEEIFSIGTDGNDFRRITDNNFWDLYPAWSPDGSKIAFLSQRGGSLGIYRMNSDGSGAEPVYDSGAHEADIDWVGDRIVFTKDSSIWMMQSDGTNIFQVTHPPRAGEWGRANLPFGDYDPRLSPDGSKIVFERLVDDQSANGNYDLFTADALTGSETRLTHSGYSQGLASWSNSGERILYIVAAIGDTGQYDLYWLNGDGTENRNITPSYFPPEFLCHWAIFSTDDSAIFFIGEWYPAQ